VEVRLIGMARCWPRREGPQCGTGASSNALSLERLRRVQDQQAQGRGCLGEGKGTEEGFGIALAAANADGPAATATAGAAATADDDAAAGTASGAASPNAELPADVSSAILKVLHCQGAGVWADAPLRVILPIVRWSTGLMRD